MWIVARHAIVAFLVYFLPMDVIAKCLVILLRKVAKYTKNTTDDEIVEIFAKKFEVEEIRHEPPSHK